MCRSEFRTQASTHPAFQGDTKVLGLLLMDDHWCADTLAWLLWDINVMRQLPGPDLQALLAVRWLMGPKGFHSRFNDCFLASAPTMTWRYSKLSLLVAHVEANLATRAVAALLGAIEDFARMSSNQWIKIAGGDKAHVLASAADSRRACVRGGTLMTEFGAFVGYSTAHLATYSPVTSLEHDPVHARIAEHMLDLMALSDTTEVWIGRVSDLTPRFAEMYGETAVSLIFLDESGSTFETDLSRVEKIRCSLLPSFTLTVADNCLRPGAPSFLFARHQSQGNPANGRSWVMQSWSLPEFLEEEAGVEDWVVVLT